MTDNSWIAFHWGKARGEGQVFDWHPLCYHALDVAASMEALITADPLRLQALEAFSAGSRESIRAALILVAALHDLGKFSPAFQKKAPLVPPGAARTHLSCDDIGHDLIGCHLWGRYGKEWLELSRQEAGRLGAWVSSACCHHSRGQPARSETAINDAGFTQADLDVARQFVIEVSGLQAMQGYRDLALARDVVEDECWVAGLVSIADWIGSNKTWFQYHSPTLSIAEYWEVARCRAALAVRDAGLNVKPRARPVTLKEALQIEQDPTPTPLQKWVSEVDLGSGQVLCVLEDLTGAGKTEAATLLAGRIIASGRASGAYWAMPTMATANAMYGRMAPLASTLFEEGASATLMTGKRKLNDLFREARKTVDLTSSGVPVGGSHTIPAEVFCADWLARDARVGFLAPMGAGTVDQALLGLLPSRHFPVRLAGLSGRVLIVDEAHAYDAYTGRLLEQLLTVHARAGGSAIVLSATLTTNLHAQLVTAWRKGRKQEDETVHPAPLPAATLITDGSVISASIAGPAGRGTHRDTPIEWLRLRREAVALIAAAADQGAACLWICNTVDDAIEACDQLKATGHAPLLFHSRFTAGDRQRIEREVLSRFGRAGTGRGGILVATQVAEQSLDVDFDVLVSDLAPIDSLIQRAGRLHRHDRLRPIGYEAPVLVIVGPPANVEATGAWYASAFPLAAYVYQAHGRLWRTVRRLELDGGLNLLSQPPRDLLDWVYGDHAGTPDPLRAIDDELELGARLAERGQGAMATVETQKGYRVSSFVKEERAITRLGEPTVPVVLARIENSKLRPLETNETELWRAWAMSEIGVPESKAGDADIASEMVGAVMEMRKAQPWIKIWVLDKNGRVRVKVGDRRIDFSYTDRYGLRVVSNKELE